MNEKKVKISITIIIAIGIICFLVETFIQSFGHVNYYRYLFLLIFIFIMKLYYDGINETEKKERSIRSKDISSE